MAVGCLELVWFFPTQKHFLKLLDLEMFPQTVKSGFVASPRSRHCWQTFMAYQHIESPMAIPLKSIFPFPFSLFHIVKRLSPLNEAISQWHPHMHKQHNTVHLVTTTDITSLCAIDYNTYLPTHAIVTRWRDVAQASFQVLRPCSNTRHLTQHKRMYGGVYTRHDQVCTYIHTAHTFI